VKNDDLNIQDVKQVRSDSERKKIIRMYAEQICRIWDNYERARGVIRHMYRDREITRNQGYDSYRALQERTMQVISELIIEQFYNTGDEDLFERAMMIDEEVILKTVSFIESGRKNTRARKNHDLLVFFRGIFLRLKKPEENPVPDHQKIMMIVRDEKIVERVNKKLSRGRSILAIDEVTLGKKFYEGLYQRTRYV